MNKLFIVLILTFNIGYLHASFKTQALTELNEIIELNPTSAKNYNRRGIVNFELGNIEEAIQDLKKAIKLDPKLTEAYNNLVVVRNSKVAFFYNLRNEKVIKINTKDSALNSHFAKNYYAIKASEKVKIFIKKDFNRYLPNFKKGIVGSKYNQTQVDKIKRKVERKKETNNRRIENSKSKAKRKKEENSNRTAKREKQSSCSPAFK